MYEVLTEQLTILSIQYDVAAVPIKHVIVPSIQYDVPAVSTECGSTQHTIRASSTHSKWQYPAHSTKHNINIKALRSNIHNTIQCASSTHSKWQYPAHSTKHNVNIEALRGNIHTAHKHNCWYLLSMRLVAMCIPWRLLCGICSCK